MAIESTRDGAALMPLDAAAREALRKEARNLLHQALTRIDDLLQRSESRQARTLVATTLNIVKEARDLLQLAEDVYDEWE